MSRPTTLEGLSKAWERCLSCLCTIGGFNTWRRAALEMQDPNNIVTHCCSWELALYPTATINSADKLDIKKNKLHKIDYKGLCP